MVSTESSNEATCTLQDFPTMVIGYKSLSRVLGNERKLIVGRSGLLYFSPNSGMFGKTSIPFLSIE
jgi:hypothetical protein